MFVGRQKIKEEKRKKEEMNDGRKKLSNTVDVYFWVLSSQNYKLSVIISLVCVWPQIYKKKDETFSVLFGKGIGKSTFVITNMSVREEKLDTQKCFSELHFISRLHYYSAVRTYMYMTREQKLNKK